jgi:hypothetical protein
MFHQADIGCQFAELQQRFIRHYREIFSNDLAEKTVIIIPGLTLDQQILETINGIEHYEERMLCMLMLLRMPHTKLIYISSVPVDNSIIDYYLGMLPGITNKDAHERLTLLSCYDASVKPLAEKILERPRLLKRILEHVDDPEMAHISCFNVTELEKRLSVLLNIPLYGTDPSLLYFGTKSGSKRLFKKIGINTPAGFEDLKTEEEIIRSLAMLKKNNPLLKKAVIKMNDGFSGEGNAIYYYENNSGAGDCTEAVIENNLPHRLKIIASHIQYWQFIDKFQNMGGIVEELIDAETVVSPSVQCRINPLRNTDIISTHDQLLGGEGNQVFLGATFPANAAYSKELALLSNKVAEELLNEGVLGRFSIDFLSVKREEKWEHYAIEINLRKGGTTHPFLMLQFLTGGKYDWQEGIYKMPNGETRCYFATDNLASERYKGLIPHDLVHIAVSNGLLYKNATQSGVMFHMIGALSQYGKLGLVCIGANVEEAKSFYFQTIEVLDKECIIEPI